PVSPGLPFAPYVQGRFAAGHDWWVFSPFALAQAPEFRAVAV
ncbi:chemotaxis protein CheW, partial [Pseudomonas lundensis]